MSTTLQRVNMAAMAPAKPKSDLATKAAEVLGYKTLSEAESKTIERRLALDDLALCGMVPFTEESVQKYKRAEVRRQSTFFASSDDLSCLGMVVIFLTGGTAITALIQWLLVACSAWEHSLWWPVGFTMQAAILGERLYALLLQPRRHGRHAQDHHPRVQRHLGLQGSHRPHQRLGQVPRHGRPVRPLPGLLERRG